MMSGLMGTMAQGLAFGTGSAVAHRAVGAASNAIFGGSDSAPVEQYEQVMKSPRTFLLCSLIFPLFW